MNLCCRLCCIYWNLTRGGREVLWIFESKQIREENTKKIKLCFHFTHRATWNTFEHSHTESHSPHDAVMQKETYTNAGPTFTKKAGQSRLSTVRTCFCPSDSIVREGDRIQRSPSVGVNEDSALKDLTLWSLCGQYGEEGGLKQPKYMWACEYAISNIYIYINIVWQN